MRIQGAIVILIVAHALAGCDGTSAPPTSPSANPPTSPSANPPTVPGLVSFTDSASGFSTSDLRDAEDEVMQLSTAGELVFPAANLRLPGYRRAGPDLAIAGSICSPSCDFVVRFGTKDGARRAYLTVDYGHDNPGTLVDVEVANGALVVTQTDRYPPGSPTLSGIVTETASGRLVPVAGVTVYRGVITGWRVATTDQGGFYEIRGLFDGIEEVDASKEGYETKKSSVPIKGDTRFDMTIVRR
jgi:hypothetical protein